MGNAIELCNGTVRSFFTYWKAEVQWLSFVCILPSTNFIWRRLIDDKEINKDRINVRCVSRLWQQ